MTYQTQLFTCTCMVPVGSSVILELVLAVHRYQVIAYFVPVLIRVSEIAVILTKINFYIYAGEFSKTFCNVTVINPLKIWVSSLKKNLSHRWICCSSAQYMSRLLTKPTKWHVHPAKKAWVLGYPLSAQRRLGIQADLNLRWCTVILLVLSWSG